MTRNEEVIETDDIIDSFPLDEELVNSETGELYDLTDSEAEAVPDPITLSELERLAAKYGISAGMTDEND
ncbi:hypothetical protein MPH_07515 [Macrophomina phaseolina MS6]|nr:hypothetical protein MPH_07515 [Macrophomina phaseolina MS6]